MLESAIHWQDKALALERENAQLKRRLASAEAELNLTIDQLEAAGTRITFLEEHVRLELGG